MSIDAWTSFTLSLGSYRNVVTLRDVALDWLKIENSMKSNKSMKLQE